MTVMPLSVLPCISFSPFSHHSTVQFDHSEVYNPPAADYYNQIATHTLKDPVEARYVIIRLLDYDYTSAGHLYNVLRTELYGCPMETLQTGKLYTLRNTNLFIIMNVIHANSGK